LPFRLLKTNANRPVHAGLKVLPGIAAPRTEVYGEAGITSFTVRAAPTD
jgi:hypothetical protein